MNNYSGIDSHDLVSSKENIQPLRRGRDTAILCAALQAETDTDLHHELEKQRNEFEINLRSNNSEDPLSDWCNYISWIEQSFPKQGREGKLNVVLQKCLIKFKDCEKYMNDIRFVRLCIKYAELEENTVELLSQIHRHGIGVSCAEIYIAWAEKFAADNCFKKANAIYERGLKNSAQPIELLQEAYQNFQAFLVRKVLNDREIFQPTVLEPTPSEHRQPYNILQPITTGQKEVAPSVRIGSNVIGTAGKFSKVSQKDKKLKSNTVVKVFEDVEEKIPSCEPKVKLEKVPNRKTSTKENTVKPGTWNNKKNRNALFSVEAVNLPFQVHRDENDENDENFCKKNKIIPASVLKQHKVSKPTYEDENFTNAPLFYSEPYDPTKLPMYCKEQVYAGGLEFQFEELRAIIIRRKRQEELDKNLYKTDVVQSMPFETLQTPLNIKLDSHSKSTTEKRKKLGELSERKEPNNYESRKKGLLNNPPPAGVPEENLVNNDYSMNQTIHTKEALSEMQQLWFSKPASPVTVFTKPKATGKSILKPSKPCFSLYVDESCLENFKVSEEDRPLDLTLKTGGNSQDDDYVEKESLEQKPSTAYAENINSSIEKIENLINNKENFDSIKALELQNDEDKENGIPVDYCGPVGKSNRKVSGILTPAENIDIAQLSDEEIEINDDEDEDDDDEVAHAQDFSSIMHCNTTAITETWNFTKGFQFPRGESTPNVRNFSRNKVDYGDSIIFSEPKPEKGVGNANKEVFEAKKECVSTNSVPLNDKKNIEGENHNKNLSVIAETSREYRSSSSASSGASTLALRSSKNIPFTPSDIKNSKCSLTISHTILQKTKAPSYASYEASSESSHVAQKSPKANKVDGLNTTYNLMAKLKTIENASVSIYNDEEEKLNNINDKTKLLDIQEKEICSETRIVESIDPFDNEVIEKLLKEIEFPTNNHLKGYFLLHDRDLPTLKVGSCVTLGAFNYDVKKLLGEGAYAKIYRLIKSGTAESMIAKYQKPAFSWEYYIARELQSRIKETDMLPMYMKIEEAYIFKNCSVYLTRPVEYGDLLSVINKLKQGKMICQLLAMHFTCQILKIIETLHSCNIIHGDIKPDNFLLRNYNDKLHLQLIDFGRSIDMSLFPKNTTFTKVVTTESFTTIEMKLGKPWTYQIDYYGAANCGHCLLFGDYMKVHDSKGVWSISKIIPRYWAKNEWNNFFTKLLNVECCSKLPDLSELRKSFEAALAENSEIEFSLFKLKNLLNDR